MQEKNKSDQIIDKLKTKIMNQEEDLDKVHIELEVTIARLKEVESLWELVV